MATINNVEVQGDKNGNDYGLANLTDLASKVLELTNRILANSTAIADNLSEINLHKANEDRHVTPALINSLVRKEVLGLYYTAAQVAEMINDISVGGGAHLKVVDELPETGLEQIIYLVPNGQTGDNVKDEYIWIDNKWEVIGSTSIDLTDYYTKNEVNSKISNLDSKYVKVNDTTLVKLNNLNEINLQEDHYNAWFGYRDGKVTNWKFGDGTEGGYANIYAKDFYLNDQKLSDLLNGKAIDSDTVHKTGTETISGSKTFTSSITIEGNGKLYQAFASDYVKGVTPSIVSYQGLRFYDDQKVSTVGNHITGAFEIQYNTDGYNKAYVGCRNYAGTTQHNYTVGLRVPNDLTRSIDFLPSATDKINLGAPDFKWLDVQTEKINGETVVTPIYLESYLENKTEDWEFTLSNGSSITKKIVCL